MNVSGPAFSILIRAYNSEKTLGRLLSALVLQPEDEIIVVDSGSTDGTLDLAARHGARIVHAPPPFNYSKSLNLGFRAARHDWVLVLSSHIRPLVPDLLGAFRAAARVFPPEVPVGYGPNQVDWQRRERDDTILYFTRTNFDAFGGRCHNANTLYRRSAWEALPFDETIRTAEDVQWLHETVARGNSIAVVPAARAINMNRYSLRYMFMKGYSDRRASGDPPMTAWQLVQAAGTYTKKFFLFRMPYGNWIRLVAHSFGVFFGSRARQDNDP